MLPEIVETERLRLEPRTPEYVDPLVAYKHCKEGAPGMEEVTEYLPWDPHPHPRETLEFLEQGAEMREEHEGAGFVIRPKDGEEGAGELAGFGGLGFDWEKDTAVLGTWLRKPFWGRGYSGERALALAELAFEGLDFGLLAVDHEVGNEKSERAITKYIDRMGGRREGTLRNHHSGDDGPVDAVRYSVTQDEYREAAPEQEVTFYDGDGGEWP